MLKIPFERVNWVTSSFLIGTFLMAITATPIYLWYHDLDAFQIGMFIFYYFATGFSITLGYHRLFSHRAFQAKLPVKLFTLIFGAASFENSALDWVSDHRRHHKHTDHDEDPYDITKGFFHAHIGWLLFRLNPVPPMDNVGDLRKDKWVMFQYRHWVWVGIFVGFILPALLGWWWNGAVGAWGGFLISGVLRVVVVQQNTFFINSLCHTIGAQPYSSRCSARDSWIMALFTYGEGYHNYHHEFQHDYRNGVKAWQFDPTKWIIWTLEKMGLTSNLKRVPNEKILLSQMAEKERWLQKQLEKDSASIGETTLEKLNEAKEKVHLAQIAWEQKRREYIKAAEETLEASKEYMAQLQKEWKEASDHLKKMIREWVEVHDMVQLELAY